MSDGIELGMVSRIPVTSMSSSAQMEAVSDEEEREPLLDIEKQEEQEPLLDIEEEEEQEPLLDIEKQEERKPLLDTKKQEEWDSTHVKSKHTIFLSYSGAQKNFAEQLCEDLEAAKRVPFFDKRPDSLPDGEKFAELIFRAARQCRLAIVVLSEEYLTRSKWPMLELAAFVEEKYRTSTERRQARRCTILSLRQPRQYTILPLFLGLSCEEYGDATRRERWFKRWNEWAQKDSRIDVDAWKEALRVLDGTKGIEFIEAVGEVQYRKNVVSAACVIVPKGVQAELVLPPWISSFFKVAFELLTFIFFIIMVYMGFHMFKEFTEQMPKFTEQMTPPELPGLGKPTCIIGDRPCSDMEFRVFNEQLMSRAGA